MACSPRARWSARRRTCARKLSWHTVSTTASPTAAISGLPPNVPPWSPGAKQLKGSLHSRAASGTPPPMPLASVITSGSMSYSSCANDRPQRPMPVCTSSAISSSRRSVVSARSSRTKPGSARCTPASPCTSSIITATLAGVMARSTEAMSL